MLGFQVLTTLANKIYGTYVQGRCQEQNSKVQPTFLEWLNFNGYKLEIKDRVCSRAYDNLSSFVSGIFSIGGLNIFGLGVRSSKVRHDEYIYVDTHFLIYIC